MDIFLECFTQTVPPFLTMRKKLLTRIDVVASTQPSVIASYVVLFSVFFFALHIRIGGYRLPVN